MLTPAPNNVPRWDPLKILGSKTSLMLVSLLTIVWLALGNLPWQLDDYDQAKQAFTSWQMVKSGRLLYQDTPGGKIATKPPLVGSVSAILYWATRSWDLAWRLPSFFAALAIAAILWHRAKTLFGGLAGIVSLSAFAFNLLTPRLATLVRTDMPLALVTFLIALLFFEHIRLGQAWNGRDRVMLFLLLTASMLVKGPIVYAFVAPALLLFAFRYRVERSAIATGWWPWLASFGLFVAWVIGGMRTVPGFYDEVVVREFLGRFGETIHKPQPIYFYAPHLLHKWAPWSLLLIGLIFVEARRARSRGEKWLSVISPEMFWLLGWSVGGFVIMSCIPSKRVDRIFPVVPPMCLLLACLARHDFTRRERVPRWCAATLVGAILFAGSYTLFKVAYGIRADRDGLVKCGREFRWRAAQHHWNYEVVADRDEALAMYFDRPDFIDRAAAIDLWNADKLTVFVMSERVEAEILPRLKRVEHAVAFSLCLTGDGKSRYVVLRR